MGVSILIVSLAIAVVLGLTVWFNLYLQEVSFGSKTYRIRERFLLNYESMELAYSCMVGFVAARAMLKSAQELFVSKYAHAGLLAIVAYWIAAFSVLLVAVAVMALLALKFFALVVKIVKNARCAYLTRIARKRGNDID